MAAREYFDLCLSVRRRRFSPPCKSWNVAKIARTRARFAVHTRQTDALTLCTDRVVFVADRPVRPVVIEL